MSKPVINETSTRPTADIITKCPCCNNPHIKETDNYCTQCGHNLDVYKQTFKCCSTRILIMHEDYYFCPYCGTQDPINLPGA